MKHILTLVTLALLCGCENPVDHFTEGRDRGETIVIPRCPTDSAGVDTARACGGGRP